MLLLTDMLLICKQSTKKAPSGGGSAGGLKIIRQPLVVDRIRLHELKEPSSLGLVYLNEYGAASAALVLSAGEPKLAKVYCALASLCVSELARVACMHVQWPFRNTLFFERLILGVNITLRMVFVWFGPR